MSTNYPEQDHFQYIEANGFVSIIKYIGSDSSVKIPNQINGKPVHVISDEAFLKINTITEFFSRIH